MKRMIVAAAVTLLMATPLFAQENGGQQTTGYITGFGGFTRAVSNTTSSGLIEGGVRIAPHLMVIGDVGRFGNLRADLQPTLHATTTNLANNQGLNVIGGGQMTAWYGAGGLRADMPLGHGIAPYVLGTVGTARLNPTAQFTFSSGTMPDGSTPAVGADVTSALTLSGSYTAPAPSSALMYTLGGGIQVPVERHWLVDAGYRYSRIASDSSLSASPLNTNGMTLGVGYRF